MNAPARPPQDLEDLHRLVLKLQEIAQPVDRSELAKLIIDHDAFKPRFKRAFGVVMKFRAYDSHLWDDVQQQANALLLKRLKFGEFTYQDRGTNKFGGWIYRICRTACADALKACLRDKFQSIVLMDNQQLDQCEASAEEEHSLDKLLRGIDTISDPLLRDIMLEAAPPNPMAARESAILHSLTMIAVYRLRRKGKEYLRRFFREELEGTG